MFSHIHSATVIVADQDKALAFYVDTLGWEQSADDQMGPDMRWVTVVPTGATTHLALGHLSWFGGARTPGGPSGIALVTPDIDTSYANLTERGVRFKGPVEMMPWGDKAVWFYDVDDNELFLVEEITP